jgi:hypothetical protein
MPQQKLLMPQIQQPQSSKKSSPSKVAEGYGSEYKPKVNITFGLKDSADAWIYRCCEKDFVLKELEHLPDAKTAWGGLSIHPDEWPDEPVLLAQK